MCRWGCLILILLFRVVLFPTVNKAPFKIDELHSGRKKIPSDYPQIGEPDFYITMTIILHYRILTFAIRHTHLKKNI